MFQKYNQKNTDKYIILIFVGAIPRPVEDPLADMTESEKEVEMEKLFVLMNRLKDMNVIKPMAVDKDGKLKEFQTNEDDE